MEFTALIPEGPLHPALALGAVVVGVSVAMVAGRSQRAWSTLVVAGTVGLIAAVQGDWLIGDLGERHGLTVVAAAAGVGVIAVVARPRRSTAAGLSIAACAGIWAIVPDTEAPLVAGGVLVGASAVTLVPGWLADTRRRIHGLLPVVAVLAAAIGSLGRPARFDAALLAGSVLALGGAGVVAGARALRRRRQRAGMPMTVAPAGTSSTTTAPAPTMAS